MKTRYYNTGTQEIPVFLCWDAIKGCIILLMALLLAGCDSFVDTDPPASQLDGEAVFEDSKTATAALAGVYISMRDNGLLNGSFNGITYKAGLYADELDDYGGAGANYFYTNSLFAANDLVLDTWSQSYSQLYAINAVIEGVRASSSLSDAVKAQLCGEALFLRGLVHFYLMHLYGEVPYVSSTDYRINSSIGKMSAAEMTGHVIGDLQESISLLQEDYPVAERVRPNRYAAYALLSRVLLYSQHWAEASDAASAVINSSLYEIETDLEKVFLRENPETIWQFMPNGDGNNTAEGELFIFLSGPPPQVALTPGLVSAFETGDQRKVSWVKAVSDGTDTWHHAFKYKENSNTGASKEYSIILRLAEVYLIRAEARAMQGDIIGAQQDLDMIRARAGLPPTQAATPTELSDALLRERRVELFTEMGHRFFDLKRKGAIDQVLAPVKPGWDTTDGLWPLPAAELSANPSLYPQNPGY